MGIENYNDCHICGTEHFFLHDLTNNWKVEGIEKVCSGCLYEINKQHDKLRKITFKQEEIWLKRFMKVLKDKFC